MQILTGIKGADTQVSAPFSCDTKKCMVQSSYQVFCGSVCLELGCGNIFSHAEKFKAIQRRKIRKINTFILCMRMVSPKRENSVRESSAQLNTYMIKIIEIRLLLCYNIHVSYVQLTKYKNKEVRTWTAVVVIEVQTGYSYIVRVFSTTCRLCSDCLLLHIYECHCPLLIMHYNRY